MRHPWTRRQEIEVSSASHSFVVTAQGFDLIHGSEILAGRVFGYNKEKMRGQSQHSIRNIIAAIDQTSRPADRLKHLRTMAGFMVLDALICNTDRHHDNWGMLYGRFKNGTPHHHVAPSFDHASSLGRELVDAKRERILRDGRILDYALKGSGAIYWDECDAKAENPLRLAIRAAADYPQFFRNWVRKLRNLDASDFDQIVARVPNERMTPVAKNFCEQLLRTTRHQIICERS